MKIENALTVTRFDPNKRPWHEKICPWPDNDGYQPRDCSWGFVESETSGNVHVQAGDCIVEGFGLFFFVKEAKLGEFIESWNSKVGNICKSLGENKSKFINDNLWDLI